MNKYFMAKIKMNEIIMVKIKWLKYFLAKLTMAKLIKSNKFE
jgi:hypothetical protein